MHKQQTNVFAGAFVDRIGERRKDPDWLAEAADSPDSLFVPVWRHRCLIERTQEQPGLRFLKRQEIDTQGAHDAEWIFLGLYRDQPAFAFALNGPREPYAELGVFEDLRKLGTLLAADQANLAAHARALVLWHETTLFCGTCGAASNPVAGGNARSCSNPDCGKTLFPRVDPAIIVLVERGEHCLLGRQTSWPEGRYSTVAGFAEPGESLEDAVRREVFEETNIHVGNVRYHSSQPWPFPSSLMLGFFAEAVSDDIRLNDGELEDARWFTRDDLRSGFPKLPYHISIARRLVDHWLNR
ncbi:MAG: NAD(+) diphosphatase [Pseudomonadota bacterium]